MICREPFMWTFAVIWIFSAAKVECQDCSISDLYEFEGYRYIFYHGPTGDGIHRTFSETRAHCQSLGGDMAVITSAEQNEFIASRLRTDNNGAHYYIGLEDKDNDGTYKWIDGTTPRYQNWQSELYTFSQPYCAVMRARLNMSDPLHGKWNRVACTSVRRHICQVPIAGCRWQEFGESQFLVKAGPLGTMGSAQAACQSYGGDLAMLKTAKISEYIRGLISSSSEDNTCYFFGLQRQDDGNFKWLDGTTPEFTDWESLTEPDEQNVWGCLPSSPDSGWQGRSSDAELPFICERTRLFPESSMASYGETAYFISPPWLKRTFSHARTYCQHHGADLAFIKSEDINNFLASKATEDHSFTSFFFGLTDQVSEGTFTWIDGTNLVSSFWSPNEPNNSPPGEDCACLTTTGQWIDSSCTAKKPFICEQPRTVSKLNWAQLNGRFYYVSEAWNTSYLFARKICQAQGGELAQPKTQEIQNFLLDRAGGDSFWFGLDTLSGEFQWNDGSCLRNSTFNAWCNGTMEGYGGKCIHQSATLGWSSRECSCDLRFACERPPVPPELSSLTEVDDTGSHHVTLKWRPWNSTTDMGDGPVTSYNVYVYSGNGSLVQSATVVPITDCYGPPLESTAECDFVYYNVTGLQPSTAYTFRMSVIQEGVEGTQGQAMIILTDDIQNAVTMANAGVTMATHDVVCPECSNLSWILLAVSVAVNALLAGVIIFLCVQRRRTPSTPKAGSSKTTSDPSPLYVNPSFEDSKVEDHSYQELRKVNKEANYTELQEAEYENTRELH